MTLDQELRRNIADRIRAAVPEVAEVLLFGSRARGDARPDSDVDLVLIVPGEPDRRSVAVRARRGLWGLGIGFDLLVLTREDWQALQQSSAWYDRQLTREAVRLDAVA